MLAQARSSWRQLCRGWSAAHKHTQTQCQHKGVGESQSRGRCAHCQCWYTRRGLGQHTCTVLAICQSPKPPK